MRSIAIVLKKGGVGKTTTAINIANSLMLKGKKTLLVDLDPQANSTVATGIDPTTLPHTINDLFNSITLKPQEVIVTTDFGLDVLPSHPDLAATEAGMKASQVGFLKSILEPIEKKYDYIIIDTAPSESPLTISAMAYAQELVIPVEAHFLALHGLSQLMVSIDQVRQGLNPKLKILGILPTKVNARTNMAQTVCVQLAEHYKEFLFPVSIDFSIRHPEASLAGKPIVIFDPAHAGAVAYNKVTELILCQKTK